MSNASDAKKAEGCKRPEDCKCPGGAACGPECKCDSSCKCRGSLSTAQPANSGAGALSVPRGANVQGEERVLRTETRMVNGQPVTTTFVQTRKYHSDPETGRVVQDVSETELPKEQAEAEQSKIMDEFRAMEQHMQDQYRQMARDIRRMHQDMALMWRGWL